MSVFENSIGVHCDSHDYDKIYESVDSYVRDFKAAQKTIFDITGVETNIFRFPGGSINSHNKNVREDIINEMTKRGYIFFDWNASLEDSVKQIEPDEIIANGVSTTFGRKKVVMLAHDVVYNTGICLNELLDKFPEYEMKPITVEVEPIQFRN